MTARPAQRLSATRVLRSEWTKLTTLRSTWWSLAAVVVLAIGLAGAIGHGIAGSVAAGHREPPDLAESVAAALLPMDFLVLVVGVLAVLQVTGEYGGSARATFAAVPRRWPVVAAKAVAFAALTLPVLAVTVVLSFLACQAFLDPGAAIGDPGVPRTLLGAAVSPVLIGLLAMGIGTVLRHTAVAITTLVVVLFVAPALLAPLLPGNLEDHVLKYVPTVAAQAMYGSLGGGNTPFDILSPGASAAVLAGWVALALLAGSAVLVRRDV